MKDLLDDIMGYSLDEEQRAVVAAKEKQILVVAGAGSGKSLTIIGKIRTLIEEEELKEEEILCISFTRASSMSLKKKLMEYYHYDLDVYTFHKLALEILQENTTIPLKIAPSDLLEYTVQEYLHGIILESDRAMKRVLKYFQYPIKKDLTATYQNFLNNKKEEISKFAIILSKFLRLFKGQGFQVKKFYEFYYRNNQKYWFLKKQKNRRFPEIAWDIYLFYEEELKSSNMIDFDDMIQQATTIVAKNYTKPYRYILIDEYQDTSYTRFLLIQEILQKTQANLLVVGDDFQSIYQFTGCNLNMFLNFSTFFPEAKIYLLTHTYRNSQELVDICGKFIMKNPYQIKKQLKSTKHLPYPIERYDTKDPKETLKRILKNLKHSQSIFILGRNNRDIEPCLDKELTMSKDGTIHYCETPNTQIQYLTIHKSKGLEADNVILLHVVEDKLGLPSQMEDDPILSFVLEKNEFYPFEEERRIFYVALTRTKNKVYILTEKSKESRFLKELKYDLKSITYNKM